MAAVSFIRTAAPLDPVSLVRRICEDAHAGASRQRSRYVKRMTPVSCVRKTLGNGLEQLCEEVLRPVFADGTVAKKVRKKLKRE
jgi:tRNA acetyltransferase TAN1